MFGLNLYVIGALLALNALTFGLWRHAANAVTQIEIAAQVANANTNRVELTQKQITEDTTNGWKAALDTTRRYYVTQRLRDARAGEMPAIPDATARVDAASADPVPAPPRVEEDCAITTLTTNHIQDWISAQRAVR